MSEWKEVPKEATAELIRDAGYPAGQVLAYENGRYYNAWIEHDPYEGGWLWMDDADSEPNPSHYMVLPEAPDLPSKAKRVEAVSQ